MQKKVLTEKVNAEKVLKNYYSKFPAKPREEMHPIAKRVLRKIEKAAPYKAYWFGFRMGMKHIKLLIKQASTVNEFRRWTEAFISKAYDREDRAKIGFVRK